VKRALLVGIDHYTNLAPLYGCVADATALAELLATNHDGTPNWRVTRLTSDCDTEITRTRLRGLLLQLFANARNTDLLFFFAGHGLRSAWGADLVTLDATTNSPGISMNDLVILANDSPARSVTVLLDCCFSGDTGDLAGLQAAGVSDSFRLGRTILRENVTVMAASRATEEAAEKQGHGSFARVLLDGLNGGATDHRGEITALSLYSFLSPAFDDWEQRPVLKTYVTDPTVIRVGPPWLDPGLLRRLPDHFPTDDHRLQLTPAHEGAGRPLGAGQTGTPEQQEFDYVGRLRNANLVTTDDGQDHYWVAMTSGTVRLTSLGRYFWRLAQRGLL
jgi:hypothetical protein